MENKKLLKYLLKDLIELDEMFAGEGNVSFDEMEMEFIRNRVSGATKLVKLCLEKENSNTNPEEKEIALPLKEPDEIKSSEKTEEKAPFVGKEDSESDQVNNKIEENKSPAQEKAEETEEVIPEIQAEEKPLNHKLTEDVVEKVRVDVKREELVEARKTETEKKETTNADVELEDEKNEPEINKRLGDSFLKEKSFNDSMSDDSSKLEHKLSNRPVKSIKTSIGINDKFQYIRELFEGSAETFTKAVEELDSLDNLSDAVQYLQTNYKWKKNETSLKFVNLVKRRFPNE